MAISPTAAASSTTTTSSAFFLQYFVTTVLAIITFPQQVFMFSPKCQVAVDSWQHVVCVKWPRAAAATVWCATFSVRWLMNHETTTDGSILQHNTILEGGCCCKKKWQNSPVSKTWSWRKSVGRKKMLLCSLKCVPTFTLFFTANAMWMPNGTWYCREKVHRRQGHLLGVNTHGSTYRTASSLIKIVLPAQYTIFKVASCLISIMPAKWRFHKTFYASYTVQPPQLGACGGWLLNRMCYSNIEYGRK